MEIIKKATTPITWEEVKELVEKGHHKSFFEAGDIIPAELKDGQNVRFVVAEIFDDSIAFVTEDCLKDRHCMNDSWTNKGGWRDCAMRKYLNTEIYELLPDDLKAVIAEREILQQFESHESVCYDKLWLLSRTEVGYDYETDKGDVHFSLFKDERSRVKQVEGETWWYWLRSPSAASSTAFCFVASTAPPATPTPPPPRMAWRSASW